MFSKARQSLFKLIHSSISIMGCQWQVLIKSLYTNYAMEVEKWVQLIIIHTICVGSREMSSINHYTKCMRWN